MILNTKVPLFNSRLKIYVGDDEKERFTRHVAKANGQKEADHEILESFAGVCSGTFVWLRRLDLKLFIHEMSHYVDDFMAHIGSECGETRAYVMEWVVGELWEKLKKKETKNA